MKEQDKLKTKSNNDDDIKNNDNNNNNNNNNADINKLIHNNKR